jgi:alanyl-tRNA synthetase
MLVDRVRYHDGISGNEGRNYVLRKIMRRAIYHGREHLGLRDLFFYKVCDFVVDEMRGAYPELEAQREFIGKMVRLEEERFGTTMTVGLSKLNELKLAAISSDNILFPEIAKLYDTYGTPRDLIRVFLEEKGRVFEEEDFNERFDAALQRLQQQSGIGKTERKSEISPVYAELLARLGANEFRGYETTHLDGAKVVAILDGDKQVSELKEGGEVVLDQTPFYAQSGGQVGDTGVFATSKGKATVNDTFSPVTGLILHKVTVQTGTLKVGDEVVAAVDSEKRDATRRNHTATHLVHAALKEVLGSHVKQGGSVVAPSYLRFDFTHYQPMTEAELQEVEDLVNRYILKNEPVTTDMMVSRMRCGRGVAMFGESTALRSSTEWRR